MTEAVIFLVLWAAFTLVVPGVIGFVGALASAETDQIRWLFIAWIFSLAAGIFGVIQVILHVIGIVQLLLA